MAKKNSKSN